MYSGRSFSSPEPSNIPKIPRPSRYYQVFSSLVLITLTTRMVVYSQLMFHLANLLLWPQR